MKIIQYIAPLEPNLEIFDGQKNIISYVNSSGWIRCDVCRETDGHDASNRRFSRLWNEIKNDWPHEQPKKFRLCYAENACCIVEDCGSVSQHAIVTWGREGYILNTETHVMRLVKLNSRYRADQGRLNKKVAKTLDQSCTISQIYREYFLTAQQLLKFNLNYICLYI